MTSAATHLGTLSIATHQVAMQASEAAGRPRHAAAPLHPLQSVVCSWGAASDPPQPLISSCPAPPSTHLPLIHSLFPPTQPPHHPHKHPPTH